MNDAYGVLWLSLRTLLNPGSPHVIFPRVTIWTVTLWTATGSLLRANLNAQRGGRQS